ncbi:uncharacterized protein [Apostichopus japonicus]|uniref:uncharacterized protein n=1 Tax=Stichopus japonicus TaxID=307972 RepID=UPI003AB20286
MVYVCIEQELWFVNKTEKDKIDYHRNNFVLFIEAFTLLIIMFAAVVANIATMSAILRVPSLRRNINNVLVLNLIFMDLCTSLGSMPFSFADLFNEGFLICFPVLCRMHGLFALLGCFGNFSAITVISVFRCVKILAGRKIDIGGKHVAFMLGCGWLYAAVTVIPPLTGLVAGHVYTHGTHHCSPDWKDSCGFFSLCVSCIYCITIPTMIVCYFLIRREVTKSAEKVQRFARSTVKPKQRNRKRFCKYQSKSTLESNSSNLVASYVTDTSPSEDFTFFDADYPEGCDENQSSDFTNQLPSNQINSDLEDGTVPVDHRRISTSCSDFPGLPVFDRNTGNEPNQLGDMGKTASMNLDNQLELIEVHKTDAQDELGSPSLNTGDTRDDKPGDADSTFQRRTESDQIMELSEMTQISTHVSVISSDSAACSTSEGDHTNTMRRRIAKRKGVTSKVIGTISGRLHLSGDVSDTTERRRRHVTSGTGNKRRRLDRKVTIAGMLLVLTTSVCWTPYFIVHSCHLHFAPSHAVEIFTMWIAYINTAIDPIIYAMLNKKIRLEIFRHFHICRKQ